MADKPLTPTTTGIGGMSEALDNYYYDNKKPTKAEKKPVTKPVVKPLTPTTTGIGGISSILDDYYSQTAKPVTKPVTKPAVKPVTKPAVKPTDNPITSTIGGGLTSLLGVGDLTNYSDNSYADRTVEEMLGALKPTKNIGLTKFNKMSSPELLDASTLAKMYGITYDADSIYKTLLQGVDTQYNTLYGKQKQSEGLYYDNAHTAQNTLMDSLNSVQTQAVGSGANKGMQAANMLSTALGVSDKFAEQATALAQERGLIANQHGESIAQARTQSEQASYDRSNALAELARQIYAQDMVKYDSDSVRFANLDTNNTARQQANLNAQIALNELLGNSYTSASNTDSNNKTTIKATGIQADATKKSAAEQADAMIRAAEIGAAANKYAANQNYLGQKLNADAYAKNNTADPSLDTVIKQALEEGILQDSTTPSRSPEEQAVLQASARKTFSDRLKEKPVFAHGTMINSDLVDFWGPKLIANGMYKQPAIPVVPAKGGSAITVKKK